MTCHKVKSADENRRYWIMLPFKAYIVAVPIFVLICQFLENNVLADKSNSLSYWDARRLAKIAGGEWAKIFGVIELGYITCLLVLFFNMIFAGFRRKRSETRNALVFIILGVISMCVFYVELLLAK